MTDLRKTKIQEKKKNALLDVEKKENKKWKVELKLDDLETRKVKEVINFLESHSVDEINKIIQNSKQKRGRGRPRGSKNKTPKPKVERRGRPKGSKNKTKVV